MSRIGKMPIAIPAGVEVKYENNVVTVKGKKGELTQPLDRDITLNIDNGEIHVERPNDQKRFKAMNGLYRSLISNMVVGVSEGFTKTLELIGVGYRCSNQGQVLELAIGFSHPVMFVVPKEISLETKMEKGIPPTIILSSYDKQLLGQVAARIQKIRKPEPYKGKGILFKGQQIRKKEGKSAGK